jgi:hypothetical protein
MHELKMPPESAAWGSPPGLRTKSTAHSVTDGAASIVTPATIGPGGQTGQFIDWSGNVPW